MQANDLNVGQELICMNVDRVYDWVLNQNSFNVGPLPGVTFPGLTPPIAIGDIVSLTAEVDEDASTVTVTNREDMDVMVEGELVSLQQVTLQKDFVFSLTLTLLGGITATVPGLTFTAYEQVALSAPEGTEVAVSFTNIDSFVNTPGTPDATDPILNGITLSITACQNIQSTYPVTVEFQAEYCEPREALPTSCPNAMPPQSAMMFPTPSTGNNG
ncbi:hypothetical protein [Lentibacillus saliphilus]|uniref:hypothetical protein n=1 Tax=Lentibacillus saliphilus TaxID=2737028 RepID=UPI001C303BD3|nr:hypothetical protein [Lentibacillus saliphilus]